MKSFQITAYGSAPILVDADLPEPAAGEVRIRVAACGLNFADLLMSEGTYQDSPTPPFALGMELSGTVEKLGPGVTAPAVGTRVAAFAGSGGLADYVCVPAGSCVPLPDSMPFDHAAAFLVAYGTSHLALSHRARLAAGETLLVLGAAGGVGLTAVEIGKLMGARVIAVARGQDKLAVAKQAGADHLIDAGADLRSEVKALGGADVVYDAVGGDLFQAAMRATRPDGRLLAIGFASGKVPQVPANHLLVKNLSLIGFYWGGYLKFRPDLLTASLATLLGWYAEGRLHPHVSHVLPLERAAEGLALLRDRRSTGKVVIQITQQ
ncbi:NADPH:quinone oxidoreductase family protein [Albidovulum sediminicola]|uniref:NADPH:quinone oxidoreductase family protein n=1 Tax=Albidovulum sediminicola TaxID=2984331 RepID=A0ABT2Z2I5_9RHOB|nr:NADPH:quinone oxidoreductase family protein [Defluviimonas sp. WL0075]MCV2865222.1 NADPH:quinone oxidoreductase family protein [Defluviimonas sp. WL0075]